MKMRFEQIIFIGLVIGLLGSLSCAAGAVYSLSSRAAGAYSSSRAAGAPHLTSLAPSAHPPTISASCDTLPTVQIISVNVQKRDSTQHGNDPLYVIDGVTAAPGSNALGKLSPSEIESITVLKGESASSEYGSKGKNGVVVITLKKDFVRDTLSGPATPDPDNKIFTKVEIEARFPGGDAKWNNYVRDGITAHMGELQDEHKPGTCELLFVVNTDGSVTGAQALTMEHTKLAEIAINLVTKGPKWIPAMQNGQVVKSFRKEKITFQMP